MALFPEHHRTTIADLHKFAQIWICLSELLGPSGTLHESSGFIITLKYVTTSYSPTADIMLFAVLFIGSFYSLSSVIWLFYTWFDVSLLLDLPGRVIRLPLDHTAIFQSELQPITSDPLGNLCWMPLARSVSLIDIDFGGASLGTPPKIRKCPCIYQFLPYFPPHLVLPPIFLVSLHQWYNWHNQRFAASGWGGQIGFSDTLFLDTYFGKNEVRI